MPPRRIEVESDSGDEFDDGQKYDKGKAKAKDVGSVLVRHQRQRCLTTCTREVTPGRLHTRDPGTKCANMKHEVGSLQGAVDGLIARQRRKRCV